MAYIPIAHPPRYDLILPGPSSSIEKSYDLSKYPPESAENSDTATLIPPDAKEVLLYFFVSVRDYTMELDAHRGFYEFITKDESATYTKYMNVIFTKNDYVMNSENIWLPIGEVKTLNVKLHTPSWPSANQLRKTVTHKTLTDFKKHIASGPVAEDKGIYAEFFVVGYRR